MDLQTKYDPKENEDSIYKFWLEQGYFSAKTNNQKNPFCIVIPPPNITGILHMGHALNNTIQDVLIRFKRMQGFEALWMPGTDHAGIATQNVLEKELANEGLSKEDIGREEFVKRLWLWTDKYGSTIIEQLKKLGASCDWEKTRFTMDDDYSAAVKEVFVKLYEKGLIYRSNYIINWCPRCKTALSDEEAPHSEIDGWLYYIRYYLKKIQKSGSVRHQHIVVATTRPETMLGDTAVAVNPNDSRLKWLKDTKVVLPIMERELKIIEDELVDPKFGTGIVKVTPAHDPVDFVLANKHGLDFINIMNDDATLNENAQEFRGMDRFEARQALLEVLEEKKLIEKKEPHKISAGHCYRCHTIIEPRLSLQWFVKMKPLARAAIKVVEENKITFYPARWKKVYLNWMNNIEDWCISRQIWWGHRLPVYYCKNCIKETPDKHQITNSKSHCSDFKKEGVIVFRERIQVCPRCGSKEIYQDEDVLDTWFSSWLWPFATLSWPKRNLDLEYFYPTSCLVTASEILFFWVARMIMAGLEFMGHIPFKDVLIHGTVRDEKGVKMSKSLGNIIDPQDIINKFGADALRFSLMMLASTGSDVYLSDEKFYVGRNFANKIWNATRFILRKMEEKNIPISNLNIKNLDAVDIWIVNALNATIQEATKALGNYRINDAAKKIYEFFWHIFCDWYIEITKFKFDPEHAKILVLCLLNSIKLLHPIMPFITEKIYQLIKLNIYPLKEKSIMVSSWPTKIKLRLDKEELNFVESLISLAKEIRNLKIDLGIAPDKKLRAFVRTDEKTKAKICYHKDWVVRLSNLEDIEFKKSLKRIIFKNSYLALDFALRRFDRDNFVLSLEKKVNKLENFLDKVSKKLNNKNFMKNAPSRTVEKEKDKFKSISSQCQRLKKLKNAFK